MMKTEMFAHNAETQQNNTEKNAVKAIFQEGEKAGKSTSAQAVSGFITERGNVQFCNLFTDDTLSICPVCEEPINHQNQEPSSNPPKQGKVAVIFRLVRAC
jgi:hypothetical protein